MRYNVINSGSDGNAIIIEDILLLDCGVPFSKIKEYIFNLKLIFISHLWLHSDHLKKETIKKIAFERPTLKFVCGSYDIVEILANKCNVSKKNIYLLDVGKWYDLGIIKVKLEHIEHDVPNCLIKWEYHSKKGIYAVDTSNLNNIVAKNYDNYFIEANYIEEELEKRKEQKILNNDFEIETRIKNSHLSKEQCDDFLLKNMGDNSVYIYCHQHKNKEKEL